MKKKRGDTSAKIEELMRLVEFGEYIYNMRSEMRLSLARVGEELGVSANHLSEIERGKAAASPELIRKIAVFFDVSEDYLFELSGRVPLGAAEELEKAPELQKLLSEVSRMRLDDKKKKELYNTLYHSYKKFIESDNDRD